MSKIWYNDFNVLFKNYDQFYPHQSQNNVEKKNALARFAIYYSIIILLSGGNKKWLAVSVVILLYTIYQKVEKFTNKEVKCVKPSKDNPLMNFTLDDYYKNVKRGPACKTNEVGDEISKQFNEGVVPDSFDLYDRKINQRQFYTMPVTQVINNQKEFAEDLYGDIGVCKAFGKDCAKHLDTKYHPTRSVYSY